MTHFRSGYEAARALHRWSNSQGKIERIFKVLLHVQLEVAENTKRTKKKKKGAAKNRKKLIHQQRKKNKKKIAWVTTYEPHLPFKSNIIRKNSSILYSEAENRSIFPKKMIISADRRRRNLGGLNKPTIPARFVPHGSRNKQGYFPCSSKRCDACDHSVEITEFSSE